MRASLFAGIVLVMSISGQWARAISMPSGSTVWMKFEGNAGPDDDGDDIAGSNQAGLAPPNGIPMMTITDGTRTATGFAEILPDRVRTFLRSDFTAFMYASFEDTYTVGGTASGTFDIPVSLHVTGTMRSMPHGTFGHILWVAQVQAEIGTFSPVSESGGVPLNEGFRITPFDSTTVATASFGGPDAQPNPYSVPVDITAHYTVQDVSVGDTFVIAYGINSSFAKGEIDLLDTGSVSFDLPQGVTLSSQLAQSIPEPAALGLAGAARLLRRGRRTPI